MLLQTISESEKPIEMVCNVTQMSFNDVVKRMNAEIERKHNIHNQFIFGQHFQSINPQVYLNIFNCNGRGLDHGFGGSTFWGRVEQRIGGQDRGFGGFTRSVRNIHCYGKLGILNKNRDQRDDYGSCTTYRTAEKTSLLNKIIFFGNSLLTERQWRPKVSLTLNLHRR